MFIFCKICGKKTKTSERKQIYCSQKCMGIDRKGERFKVLCKTCKKEFYVVKNKKNMITCSRKCYRIYAKVSENNPNWKNGKITKTNGYIMIRNKEHPLCNCDGYIYEHRLAVETQIGRYLLQTEQVHHLGKKSDNRPQHLMAFINDYAHKRFHKNPKNVKPEEIIFDGRNLL